MTDQTGRVPPNNNDAEKNVLGSILIDNSTMDLVLTLVNTEDFYDVRHQLIFDAMKNLHGSGPIEAMSVYSEMKKSGNEGKIGGALYLAQLTDNVVTSANVDHYARLVYEDSMVRKVIYCAQKIAADGFSRPGDVDKFVNDAKSELVRAVEIRGNDLMPERISDGTKDLLSAIVDGKDPANRIPSGFPSVDRRIGGIQRKYPTVIAGRPGMGKSALALNLLVNMCKQGNTGIYYTLEDSIIDQKKRILARVADVDALKLQLNALNKEEVMRVMKASPELDCLKNAWIYERPMDVNKLRSSILTMMLRHPLDFVIIDTMARISDYDEKENDAMRKVSKFGADIAKETGIAVIFIHHLSRGVETGGNNNIPMLSHLRGSGKIEDDARGVWFVYRPAYYSKDPDDDMFEIHIAKQTHGVTGIVRLKCDMSKMWIAERDDEDEFGNTPDY